MNILITGASKGIGKAVALSYCQNGPHVLFLVSRHENSLKELKKLCFTINPACKIFIFPCDLGNSIALNELTEEIIHHHNIIDILVNNAGSLIVKNFDDITDIEIIDMFNINLFAPAALTRNLLPALKKSKKAHVINIGSMGGVQGSIKYPGLSYYSSSKAALATLTECLAEEYKGSGISFNCLALGAVQTEMFEEAFPGTIAPVKVEEMANFIVNFSFSAHYTLNGKIIPVSLSNPTK